MKMRVKFYMKSQNLKLVHSGTEDLSADAIILESGNGL